jgi:hypothetical protein
MLISFMIAYGECHGRISNTPDAYSGVLVSNPDTKRWYRDFLKFPCLFIQENARLVYATYSRSQPIPSVSFRINYRFFHGIQVLEHRHMSVFLTVHSRKKGEVQKCLVPVFKYVRYLLTRQYRCRCIMLHFTSVILVKQIQT